MKRTTWIACVALLGAALTAGTAAADTMSTVNAPLGDSGWRVSGPSFYELNISFDGSGTMLDGTKWVAVTISKNFIFGPDDITGLYPAIELSFVQDDSVDLADTATRIIIQSEIVSNETGSTWEDYHWVLYRHGIASFNKTLTAPTNTFGAGPGFFYGPFTGHYWEDNAALNTSALVVYGGQVPSGDVFNPGTGDGAMVIDVDLSNANPGQATFKFSQFMQDPPAPEPATMGLLLVGGLVMLRKRRTA